MDGGGENGGGLFARLVFPYHGDEEADDEHQREESQGDVAERLGRAGGFSSFGMLALVPQGLDPGRIDDGGDAQRETAEHGAEDGPDEMVVGWQFAGSRSGGFRVVDGRRRGYDAGQLFHFSGRCPLCHAGRPHERVALDSIVRQAFARDRALLLVASVQVIIRFHDGRCLDVCRSVRFAYVAKVNKVLRFDVRGILFFLWQNGEGIKKGRRILTDPDVPIHMYDF